MNRETLVWIRDLKQGDRFAYAWGPHYDKRIRAHTVDRTTPTQIIAGADRFWRTGERAGLRVGAIANSSFSGGSWSRIQPLTPALEAQIDHSELTSWLAYTAQRAQPLHVLRAIKKAFDEAEGAAVAAVVEVMNKAVALDSDQQDAAQFGALAQKAG